jgi:hypothetical protein
MVLMAAPSRWASQAALDTLLRFNPQRQQLAEQIKEAQQNYGAQVSAGRTTAKETEASVQRALPLLSQAYSAAGAAAQPGATLVSQALAALPASDAQYRTNQAAMAAQTVANLAKAGASARTTMLERGTRAREGAQFSQLSAQQTLAKTLQQLFGKQRGLSEEAGAFAQSEAEKLAHEAETLEQRETASKRTAASAEAGHKTTERGQNITAQTAREGREQKAREAKGKPGAKQTAPGVKEATPDQTNKAREDIEKMRHEAYYVRRMGQNMNYEQANQALQNNVKTKAFTRAGYANSGKLRAALDLAYFGGVGEGAIGQLHGEGYGLGRLGYPRYEPGPHGVTGGVEARRR